MEAKQFPEKWAVRNSHKSLEYLSKLAKNNILIDHPYGYMFGYSETNETLYTTYFANIVGATSIPYGYTEVTLEDLIAHYEPNPKETFAMPCTEEQAKEITILLEKKGIKVSREWDSSNKILVNNLFNGKRIGFVHSSSNTIVQYNSSQVLSILGITTHPKWMPLTRGGFPCSVLREDRGDGVMNTEIFKDNIWGQTTHDQLGRFYFNVKTQSPMDLIPYNLRIAELEEKITSKRSELAELEVELKELKDK